MTEVPKFELETHFRICDNQNGTHITVKPDSDGLGLVEINDSEQPTLRLLLTKAQACLLVDAITDLVQTLPD